MVAPGPAVMTHTPHAAREDPPAAPTRPDAWCGVNAGKVEYTQVNGESEAALDRLLWRFSTSYSDQGQVCFGHLVLLDSVCSEWLVRKKLKDTVYESRYSMKT